MDLLSDLFDNFYNSIKPFIFNNLKDPEKAHNLFTLFCSLVYDTRTENLLFNNSTNKIKTTYKISNAAGFNKNGEIPPLVLYAMGFDRVVIGTVTHEPTQGNPKPRIIRFPDEQTVVNWMGLPGDGSVAISHKIINYKKPQCNMTMNIMPTSSKVGHAALLDLEHTILNLRGLPKVDRFELNLSCPNTYKNGQIDTRKAYEKMLADMVTVISETKCHDQDLYIKVSPDLNEQSVESILQTIDSHEVKGIVTTNTTTDHQLSDKGGASGNAVYDKSLAVQRMFHNRSDKYKIIACGGINTAKRLKERIKEGASEVQIYTPFIYAGPRILKEFRRALTNLH